MKYTTGAKIISELVTVVRLGKDYVLFQYFAMPLV